MKTEPVRSQLKVPCEIVTRDEATILRQLADADVLVTMAYDRAMATAGPRLRLLQVPGAGLDRIVSAVAIWIAAPKRRFPDVRVASAQAPRAATKRTLQDFAFVP